MDHIKNTENTYIKGFNEAVGKGQGAVGAWYDKAGRNIVLKSTGKAACEGGKIVTGMANVMGKGGRLILKGGQDPSGFCPECGSPIQAKPDSAPHIVAIRTASLDDPSWFNRK